MAKEIVNLKNELRQLQYEVLLEQRISCSREDNKKYFDMEKQGLPLPEGVYPYKDENGEEVYGYYTIHIPEELSEEERLEYIMLKQSRDIKIIKNCVLFFTILTAISLAISFVFGLQF